MSDFTTATREMFQRTYVSQVLLALPMLAMLWEHNRISFEGGKSIKIPLQKATTESLSQDYSMNTPLTGGKVDVLTTGEWFTKYMQHPVQYNARDIVENTGGELTAPIDTVKLVVDTSQDGFRRHLQSKIWAAAVTTPETSDSINSVPQALTHDAKYGGLTRADVTTNAWWQGASPGTIYTDQSTAVAFSLANLAKWATVCRRHLPGGMDGKGRMRNPLYCFVPEGLYQSIRTQAESKTGLVKPSVMQFKYGHESFNIYNIDICQSSWMTLNSRTASMALLNPNTWKFRIAPSRNFKITDFVWQAGMAGGIDSYLARILLAGSLICDRPRNNMLLLGVTA